MKIVIAMDSFKGSLSGKEAGMAVAEGVKMVIPDAECVVLGVGDGGEGTAETIIEQIGGEWQERKVMGPSGMVVTAGYGRRGKLAVLDIAAAAGLTLVDPDKRNPLTASTYGVGQLIAEALREGCREFIVGLGGSATNDGGVGMLKALGFRFFDIKGNPVGEGGAALKDIVSIDAGAVMPQLKEARFQVACDVTNPLTGPGGASYIFAPQKGASPEMVSILEEGMISYGKRTAEWKGKDYSSLPGTGAAGGLGYAFMVYLNGRLESGINLVLDVLDFNRIISDAALVITGEGRLDRQTLQGKTPYGILQRARGFDTKVVAIGGSVVREDLEILKEGGFTSILSSMPEGMDLHQAMISSTAKDNLRQAAAAFLRGTARNQG